MSSLFGITLSPAMQFMASLGFVIVLIFVSLLLARNFGIMPSTTARIGRNRVTRLSISEVLSLDGRRKLVLVRRDGVEHLLLLGGAQDVVVENNIEKIAREKLAAKTAAIEDEAETEVEQAPVAEEGYKISSWSIPATTGATPQIRLIPVQKPSAAAKTQAEYQIQTQLSAEAQKELRPSLDASSSVAAIVEKARDAAVQAVSVARIEAGKLLQPKKSAPEVLETQDEPFPFGSLIATLEDSSQQPAQQDTEVTSTELTASTEIDAPSPSKKAPITSPKMGSAKSKSETVIQKHIANAQAMNASIQEQIRALGGIPSMKATPAPEPLTAPAPEQVANANKPMYDLALPEAPKRPELVQVNLTPVSEPEISKSAKKTSTTDLAFFSVFGEPEASPEDSEELDSLAKAPVANEGRSYTDILDDVQPVKLKKQKEQPKKEAPEPHATYAPQRAQSYNGVAHSALNEIQFDELEQELAKLLQTPQNRA